MHMPSVEELNNSLNKVAANLRQNRFKLEQLLITIQVQQQTVMDSLQKIMEEQITLQGIVSGSLSQFEEKAGASQGFQGLFHGNPLLKNEIMQKRVALEQNLHKLREMSYQLQQKVQLLGKTIQDIGRYISPEIEQDEKKVEEIKESLEQMPAQSLFQQN
jgi:inosine/xanthosine triphosphate pyrophosphatase family protein